MRHLFRNLLLVGLVSISAHAWARSFTSSDADPLYQDTIGSQINVGNGAMFTVSTFSDFNLNLNNNTFTGPSLIQGNVAIGGAGNFSMSDGDIYGDLYVHQGGKVAFSGPAKVHGSNGINNPMYVADDAASPINRALQDYWSLSNKAVSSMSVGAAPVTTNFSLTYNAITKQYGGTINGNKNYSITSSGKTVLNLQDFVLTGGSLTLNGGATTTYIINVSNKFSINNAHIDLGIGLSSSQVLFNVLGSGSQVSLNQGTYLNGILLAAQRKVDLSGGKVYGRLIGNQVNITSGGQVISQ